MNDVVTEGSACGANGLVAKDSTGLLLSCQSGLWSKQGSNSCSAWSGDLNWLEGTAGQPGCINGSGLGNAPTADWFFVEYNRHTNPANYYVSQRAVGMTGSAAGKTWIRSQQSGSAGSGWGSWAELTSGYGQYAFAVTGYGGAFIGIGTKNPDGTFTGSVICNPYTVSVECGKGGNYYCGADAACALTRAYSGGGYTSGQNVVGAAYLPIYNVVKYSGP